jgi:hypothetical protein
VADPPPVLAASPVRAERRRRESLAPGRRLPPARQQPGVKCREQLPMAADQAGLSAGSWSRKAQLTVTRPYYGQAVWGS